MADWKPEPLRVMLVPTVLAPSEILVIRRTGTVKLCSSFSEQNLDCHSSFQVCSDHALEGSFITSGTFHFTAQPCPGKLPVAHYGIGRNFQYFGYFVII